MLVRFVIHVSTCQHADRTELPSRRTTLAARRGSAPLTVRPIHHHPIDPVQPVRRVVDTSPRRCASVRCRPPLASARFTLSQQRWPPPAPSRPHFRPPPACPRRAARP